MSGPQLLQKAVAGTLVSYPPVLAQPTSAELRYYTPSTRNQDEGDEVAATVDELSAEVSTDAEAGAVELALEAAADFVRGRRYVLELPNGIRLDVVAAKGGASATLYLERPLLLAVPAGSTVKGFAVTYALTADDTRHRGEGLALFAAVIGGETHRWPHAFRVVERSRLYTLTPDKLVAHSNLSERLRDPTDETLWDLIESAWVRYLRPALVEKQLKPERIVTPEELEPAHIAACELVATRDFTTDTVIREEAWTEFARSLRSVMASAELWYDASDSTTPTRPSVPPSFSRTRLTR